MADSREHLRQLAEEHAVLHRVANLVAHQGLPAEVFAAVAEEAGRMLEVPTIEMFRYEPDGSVLVLAGWGESLRPIGSRWDLDGPSVSALLRSTGRPARIDEYAGLDGMIAEAARGAGVRSAVGVPIIVDGQVWGGVMAGSTEPQPLPGRTEERLLSLTELIATAVANAQAREDLRRLADEQAALRHVATHVARESSPEEIFGVVTEEAARVLHIGAVGMLRFEPDETATLLAQSNTPWPPPPIGTRFTLDGENVVTEVFRTGRDARDDDWTNATGPVAAMADTLGVRSCVATPIIVEGHTWGALICATDGSEPLPPDTESRIREFTELAATAIANTEARRQLSRLADEQASLRRVATLVAEGASPDKVFSAVSREVGGLPGVELVAMSRFDADAMRTLVAGWGDPELAGRVGRRWPMQESPTSSRILSTGRPLRVDLPEGEVGHGPAAGLGVRSFAASPIEVEGRVWGALFAMARMWLPEDTESRLSGFTELVATAIANAESQSQLAASRRRIVAAADETRRVIERNLHDGTQQRLVSLALTARAAEAGLAPDQEDVRLEFARLAAGLTEAVEDLQELSRGIHPSILTDGGLGPAVRTLARRSAIPVELDLAADARYPEPIEAAAYFVTSEALANAAKHAQATRIDVSLALTGDELLLRISDDGIGGANTVGGSGLVGLRDRVEALGGTIAIESPPGHGTVLSVELPTAVDPG